MANELHQKLIDLVTEVLKYKNFEKLNVEFPEYDTTGGYAAEMIFAKVTGDKDNGSKEILNIIIKKSKNSAIVQDPFNLRQAYTNEITMYSKLIPHLNEFAAERKSEPYKNIPHCYGTIARENQYIVFLKNLKLSGFRVHNIEVPMDLNHAKLVLQAYAKLHALCFALKDQKPEIFEKFQQYCSPFLKADGKMFQCMVATIRKDLEDVIHIYEEKNRPQAVMKLKMLHEKYEGTLRDCLMNKDENYVVIRHGDCWNNNYLFHYNEGETNPDNVMIIDWQFGIFGSPVADLCNFLFGACSRKELEHIDVLLKLYYDTLSNKLEQLGSAPQKCFPEENFLKSFERYALIGIAAAPCVAKFCCQIIPNKTYDIAQAIEDGNFNNVSAGAVNEEEYFNRINGILELSIERGLI